MGCTPSKPQHSPTAHSTTATPSSTGGSGLPNSTTTNSTNKNNTAASKKKRLSSIKLKKKHSQDPNEDPHSTLVPTRPRVDSWALPHNANVVATSTTTTTAQPLSSSPHSYKQQQEQSWNALWNSHAPCIVDPQDVPQILQQQLQAWADRLGTTRMEQLVRTCHGDTNHNHNILGPDMTASSNHHHGTATTNTSSTSTAGSTNNILLQVLPQTTQPYPYKIVQYQSLALSLQWIDRVTAVAHQSAQAVQLWDKATTTTTTTNNTSTTTTATKIPRPSQVPEPTEPPPPETTVDILSYAALLGIALEGNFHQRCMLLFTLCLDTATNIHAHCAGGMPVWLLEIEQQIVVSVASLTHYHYYGTAYLPNPSPQLKIPHVPSKSRSPMKIPLTKLRIIVQDNQEYDPELLQTLPGDSGEDIYWTLDEFRSWADQHLNLERIHLLLFHQLAVGIFPSPKEEYTQVMNSVTSTVSDSLSNIDGMAGYGKGLFYCVDRQWWEKWNKYVRDNYAHRPEAITNHRLVGPSHDGQNRLLDHVKQGEDYVLLLPATWDKLFQLYGGGPPLPRMALEFEEDRSYKIPATVSIMTHPWIIHCHLCDPQQPYRRGDVGSFIVRAMVHPDQPMWRLLSEMFVRFPLNIGQFRAYDEAKKEGKVRLWLRTSPNASSGAKSSSGTTSTEDASAGPPRYGPWTLLCRNRFAPIRGIDLYTDSDERRELIESWKTYTENKTVKDMGLESGNHVLLEFAVPNPKSEQMTWPREAAAKAGMVKQIAEEDRIFRQVLQGVDDEGHLLLKPPQLVGMEVDAMDSTGRWYPVKILAVDLFDEDETEVENDDVTNEGEPMTRKSVKVSFEEHKGHIEWIDVESDRIAKLGRFTGDTDREEAASERPRSPNKRGSSNGLNGSNHSAGSNKIITVKRSSSGEAQNDPSKVCQYPGFGACGLANLGNTCYANSAIQCISYTPFLRSFLLSNQYKVNGDLNKDNPLGTGGKLLEEFAELLRIMWSGKFGEKSPMRFRSQLGKINPQFSGADQQDAQEFLNYIMDALHEDSNRIKKKPYVESLEDDWVVKNALSRVGDEAWRRFLRRNSSIMSDIAMGQVLNTVKCPECKFSSRNFDPFSILSIPIPTNSDILFECVVFRRMDAFNCPHILNRAQRGSVSPVRFSRVGKGKGSLSHPPIEKYIISMSRLTDSSEIVNEIERVSGIHASRLRVCRTESLQNEGVQKSHPANNYRRMIPLTDKEGPCSQLNKKRPANDNFSKPFVLYAFESSLKRRSMRNTEMNGSSSVDDGSRSTAEDTKSRSDDGDRKMVDKILSSLSDEKECRLFDTDSSILSKFASQMMFPADENDFQVGLRLDAKDQSGKWFMGSIVEVIEEEINASDVDSGTTKKITSRKMKVHFDNFSPKWDLIYDMNHLRKLKVLPLHSQTPAKKLYPEFLVYHRSEHPSTGGKIFFGNAFIVQVQSEWSCARAGAQILAQATRFVTRPPQLDDDDSSSTKMTPKLQMLYDKTESYMSQLIDVLTRCESEALAHLLSKKEDYGSKSLASMDREMRKEVDGLLARCPFDIRYTHVESIGDTPATSNKNDDEDNPIFPLTLTRTIGNFLTPRVVLVLDWRQPTSSTLTYSDLPVSYNMYREPPAVMDSDSVSLLEIKTKEAKEISDNMTDGVDLKICLKEFCKTQRLSLDDNWRCPRCKDFREGRQSMQLWRLPDILTFHLKRFDMSARWREKIQTKVNFPLYGLDMSEWCHENMKDSNNHIYDLYGVVNHYGSMTGGHYIAACKATPCGKNGHEPCVAYAFPSPSTSQLPADVFDEKAANGVGVGGWRLKSRSGNKQSSAGNATSMSKFLAESAEDVWFQFDDELVETIPAEIVPTESAYVLFYRRREVTPSHIAKYHSCV